MQWRWARAHDTVDITGEGGALATRQQSGWGSVVCGEVLQAEGEAYAEFTWVSGRNYPMVGVARAGVDPSSVSNGLKETADGWMYNFFNGIFRHNGAQRSWASGTMQGIAKGETVGLLLRQGSLSVYIQGKQVGTMVTGLTGELVWATDLHGSVRIARAPAPE